MKDLVRDLGKDGFKCINYLKNKDVQGVREEGTCSFEHNQITIDLFSDAKTAKSTFNIMKSMMSGYSLGSNNWIITLDDAALSKSISKGLRLKILS